MMKLYTYVVSRLKSEKGQGIVEYALLLAFVVAIAKLYVIALSILLSSFIAIPKSKAILSIFLKSTP